MLWARQSVNARERVQRQIKAELLLDGVKLLGVDALGVGDGELAFGLPFLVDEARKRNLPYVSANLADRDSKLLFPAARVVVRGELRLGITSVLSDQLHVAGGRVLPAVDSLRAAVRQLIDSDKVDLVVVLSHLGLGPDQQLPEQIEGIDLIFGGHSRSSQETPIIVGTTAIFQAGSRGKYLGQVTISLRDGGSGWTDPAGRVQVEAQRAQLITQISDYDRKLAELTPQTEGQRSRLERVVSFSKRRLDALPVPPRGSGTRHLLNSEKIPLDRGLQDHDEMAQLVDRALQRLGPEDKSALSGLDKGGHDHDHAAHADRPVKPGAREYGDFVGAEACRACHQKEHADWLATPHAQAYTALVKERRHFDLDCWSCHVTGAGQPGGPGSPYDVGPMRNVQCEACHGAGRKHISNPATDMVRVPVEAHCKRCHDDEQTEGRFDYLQYLPRIDHKS
jgi:hypothetical protein